MPRNYLDLPWEVILHDDATTNVLSWYREGGKIHPSLEVCRFALAVLTVINDEGEALEKLLESPQEYDGTCRSAAKGYHSLPEYILYQVSIASQSPQVSRELASETLKQLDDKEVREKAKLILGHDVPEDFNASAIVGFLNEAREVRTLLTRDPTGLTVVNYTHGLASSTSYRDNHPTAYSFGSQKTVERYGILHRASAERLKN